MAKMTAMEAVPLRKSRLRTLRDYRRRLERYGIAP